MMLERTLIIAILLSSPLFTPSMLSQEYPMWRVGGSFPLSTLWDESPLVVVGVLKNARQVGIAKVADLPPGVDPRVKQVFWCSGELHVSLILKGFLREETATRRYMWGTIRPNCSSEGEVSASEPHGIRIWFLREDGTLFRPVYDAGSHRNITLVDYGNQSRSNLSKDYVGLLLIDPRGSMHGIEDLKGEVFVNGYVSCQILGSEKCVTALIDISNRYESLRDETCQFLKTTFDRECR